MKLLAIVGTNADFSYNRFLEQFMAKRYQDQAEIEVYEIADLPRFKKEAQPDSKVEEFKNKIREADGVIFATPISPSAKCVKPFLISPHFFTSKV